MSTPINTLTPSQNAIDGALMLDLALEIDPSAAPATLDSSDSPLPLTPTVDDAAAQAYVLGTDGNDVLSGTAGDDIVLCAGGSDTVLAWTGNDTITAGTAGHNYIDAGAGDDTIYGALAGNDKLIGGADNDVIIAGGGEQH